jgi:hypothetical protein
MSAGVRGGGMSDMSVMSIMSDTSKQFTAIEMGPQIAPCSYQHLGHERTLRTSDTPVPLVQINGSER